MTEKFSGSAIANRDASTAGGTPSLKIDREVIAWLAGAALLIVLGVAVSFWTFRQIEEAAAVRKHTNDVLNSANVFLSELKDAETGQRGYLLTDDKAFLETYLAVRNRIGANLEKLRQITLSGSAQRHLEALSPLVDAKLAQMEYAVNLQRNHDTAAALASERSKKHGLRLMDSIRTEMAAFIQVEEGILAQREEEFQSSMRQLFTIIVVTSLLALLFALAFARLIYRESQQRLKNIVHSETRHLLEIQEDTNKQLQRANLTLLDSEERLAVTLSSIGDAVIATDAEGLVVLMNPLAEKLTGWLQAEANGRPVNEIFRTVSYETRQPSIAMIEEILTQGTILELNKHSVLIARNGNECDIADNCAPIRNRDGRVVGAVLVFRDITKEFETQHTLSEQRIELEIQNEELRRAHVELDASRARYFDLYAFAPVGYVTVSKPGLIMEANFTAAALLGMTRDLLVMQPISRFIFNEDADIFYLMRKQLIKTGNPQACELRIVNQVGTQTWIHLSIATAQDNNIPVFRIVMSDISERKQIEENQKQLDQRLRDQQFYTRSLIESNIDALMATDPSGIITDVNKQMEALTGYSRDELIGTPFKNYFTNQEHAEAAIKQVLSKNKVTDYELTALSRDGSETVVSYNAATFYDRDRKLQGVFAAARDVTEHKYLETVLMHNNVELQSAKAVAEKASNAKSVFLSSMSHELRTPLNAILGFAQLLEAGSPPPTDTQMLRLQQIIKAGWYLLELINEILDLAVIESGKLMLSQEAVPLAEVMRECQAMTEAQAQNRGIRINFLPIDNSWYVNADRTRVKQVLINLLSNAIKYNREKGTVEVKCTCTPKRMRISIKDNGAGLSPEKLSQLFQPFNRLGQEAGNEEGTGIGLVVTKQLVELMGGTINVESTVGVGSEFRVELIRDLTPQLAAGNTKPAKFAPKIKQNTAFHTLLYVEDNPSNLMLVEQIIASLPQIRLLNAPDGKLGVALARNQFPDVILMDINLPGISGTEALKMLRKDPSTAHIPVIALSANAMARDIEKGLEAGFFRYLTKPIKINEFISALEEALVVSEIKLTDTEEMGK